MKRFKKLCLTNGQDIRACYNYFMDCYYFNWIPFARAKLCILDLWISSSLLKKRWYLNIWNVGKAQKVMFDNVQYFFLANSCLLQHFSRFHGLLFFNFASAELGYWDPESIRQQQFFNIWKVRKVLKAMFDNEKDLSLANSCLLQLFYG